MANRSFFDRVSTSSDSSDSNSSVPDTAPDIDSPALSTAELAADQEARLSEEFSSQRPGTECYRDQSNDAPPEDHRIRFSRSPSPCSKRTFSDANLNEQQQHGHERSEDAKQSKGGNPDQEGSGNKKAKSEEQSTGKPDSGKPGDLYDGKKNPRPDDSRGDDGTVGEILPSPPRAPLNQLRGHIYRFRGEDGKLKEEEQEDNEGEDEEMEKGDEEGKEKEMDEKEKD